MASCALVALVSACSSRRAPPIQAPSGAATPPTASTASAIPREATVSPLARPREPASPEPAERPPFSADDLARIEPIAPLVHAAASRHGVDPYLLLGLIWVESGFRPRARGKSGSQGLMQLMPKTSRSLAKALKRRHAPFDADFNVDAGAYYLSRLLERFDHDPKRALAAYQRGPGIVAGWAKGTASTPLRDGLPEHAWPYVEKVLRAAAWFRTLDAPTSPPKDPAS